MTLERQSRDCRETMRGSEGVGKADDTCGTRGGTSVTVGKAAQRSALGNPRNAVSPNALPTLLRRRSLR
ncbi:hypothetical protein LC593_24490 [Nostoc sp. CHAB 5844]|nr:hypothetical protein [Nostoc sp. CHAB 5844]